MCLWKSLAEQIRVLGRKINWKNTMGTLSLKLEGADCNGRISNTERDKDNTEVRADSIN